MSDDPAVVFHADMFGITCIECGQPISDYGDNDSPWGETENGPVHIACADDGPAEGVDTRPMIEAEPDPADITRAEELALAADAQEKYDELVADSIAIAFGKPRQTTAGEIVEGDTMLWLGVAREIGRVRKLTEGMVRMWFDESWWFDIPARTPVQRIPK